MPTHGVIDSVDYPRLSILAITSRMRGRRLPTLSDSGRVTWMLVVICATLDCLVGLGAIFT